MTAGPAWRGPGSNQYADKPARPPTYAASTAGALRAQAKAVSEGDSGQGVETEATAGPPTNGVSQGQFTILARGLAAQARLQGLRAPGFKTLPMEDRRSLRRYADGGARVTVPTRGRHAIAVVDDMVDGVVRANELEGIEAARTRLALWESIDADGLVDRASPQ